MKKQFAIQNLLTMLLEGVRIQLEFVVSVSIFLEVIQMLRRQCSNCMKMFKEYSNGIQSSVEVKHEWKFYHNIKFIIECPYCDTTQMRDAR